MRRVVPDGMLHPPSPQSASLPDNAEVPPARASGGEKNMENPGSPFWLDAPDVTNNAPVPSATRPVESVLSVAPVLVADVVVMLTLLKLLVPESKTNDPVAVAPSPNVTAG